MGPPIERWCQVSVEMGPPIERRCQVSNLLIKRNPPKFINFRPAEEPMKGFSRPMPFLAQKIQVRKKPFTHHGLHLTSWLSSNESPLAVCQEFFSVTQSVSNSKRRCKKTYGRCHLLNSAFTLLNALCLQCFNPSGTHHQDKSYKFLIGQCLHNFK